MRMLLVAITLMVSVLPTHVCYTLEKGNHPLSTSRKAGGGRARYLAHIANNQFYNHQVRLTNKRLCSDDGLQF
jgi:hypothetical protein